MRVLVLGGAAWNTMIRLDRFPEPRSQTIFSQGCHEGSLYCSMRRGMPLKPRM